MDLKKNIKELLDAYACVHKGGKLWDEVIKEQRNEDLVNDLFALYNVSVMLPNIDELNKEVKEQIEKHYLDDKIPEVCKSSFTYGFTACFNWLRIHLKNKGN